MAGELKSFRGVIKELAEKYGIQEETVEAIIVDWIHILFVSITGENISNLEY